MTNDWILDVLSDLQRFARENTLTVLADHLEEATVIARTEVAELDRAVPSATVTPLRIIAT